MGVRVETDGPTACGAGRRRPDACDADDTPTRTGTP